MATSDRTTRLNKRTARSSLSTGSQNAAAPTPAEAPGRVDVDAGKKRKRDHQANEELHTILAKIGRLNGQIYAAGNHEATIAAQLLQGIQGSVAMKEELQKHYATLREKVECLQSYRDEKEASIVPESSRNELSKELSRTQQKRLNDQLEQKRLNDQLEQERLNDQSELHEVREDTHHKSAEINSLLSELGAYKELMGASVSELENVIIQCDALEETCSNQTEMIRKLQSQLASMTKMLAEAEQKNVDGEKLRKKLHNTILELKGNVRVFCRVRPLLSNDRGAISYRSEADYIGRGVVLNHNTQEYRFVFDKVFDHLASQQDVFNEISELVQSALDGHKVCIFAYGQTGSGKTHTMIGNLKLNDLKGIIPRSFEQVFQTSQCSMSQGWKYNMQASLLEIYNENIYDLLATSRTSIQDNGNGQVSGLTIVDVRSMDNVSSLLERAAQRRSVGKTEMNEESSRSHCVFTLKILGVNEGTEQQVQGALNLIDLAGSERVSKSGATGDRLKEAKAINKSLSCLADVFYAIAKKDDHIPFRNSKLTHLLQPCLGGDSKTVMILNLSPDVSNTGESLCSLRFAARVNACEIGGPHRQT